MLHDIHHAFRLLRKSPGFTIVAILTLGISIGANITIFGMINAVLVRPLAAPQSEKLVRLYETNERPLAKGSVSAPNFLDWRERTSGFESMGAYAPRNFALQGRTGSERVLGAAVSANYFQVIGVGRRWGRSFGPEEDRPGRDHVVIISAVLCRRLYGEQKEVLGHSVQLNSETYTIVGIAPAGFCFPNVDTEVWIPLAFSGNDLQARNNHWLNVVGRLRAGASIAGVQEQMSSIGAVLARQYPSQQTGRGIHVVSLHDDLIGETGPTFWLLQSAVACMLLIACGMMRIGKGSIICWVMRCISYLPRNVWRCRRNIPDAYFSSRSQIRRVSWHAF
jgi:putative ABC transport system permease protein